MLRTIRSMIAGRPAPDPVSMIPQKARTAHHDLVNTALSVKRVAREIDRKADELLEILYRDIKGKGDLDAQL